MRRILVGTLVAAAVIACAPAPSDNGASRDAVNAALEAYRTAIESKNLVALEGAFYQPADSIVVTFTDSRVTGKAIIDGYRGWFAAADTIRLSYRDVSIHVAPSGDAAWVSYFEDGSEVVHGKKEEWRGRRATLGWQKQNGVWRIVQTHWSDLPPADTTKK